MIARLDARLIAAHQWLVDLTQRSPAWLARQCCLLGIVVVLARYASVGFAAWALAVMVVAFAGLAAITLVPGWFHLFHRERWLRMVFLAVLAFDAALLLAALALGVPAEALARFTLASLADLAMASHYYFAACRPPRPRAPRSAPARLAPGGAL